MAVLTGRARRAGRAVSEEGLGRPGQRGALLGGGSSFMLGEKGGAASCKGLASARHAGLSFLLETEYYLKSKNRHSPRLTCGMILQAA